jgi:uridine kinase
MVDNNQEYKLRALLLEQVARHIASVKCSHPFRVAIDGVDAAGKTTFADELVGPLQKLGRHVIRASIDAFHHPRSVRYRRGTDSPEGYFFDSFDYAALKSVLLTPLGPDGDLRYQTDVFDYRQESPVCSTKYQAEPDSILIFDGVFLLRPELTGCLDLTIFLDVNFEAAVERATQRDQSLFGSAENIEVRYWRRYVPGQRIYLQTCRPKEYADIIIDNNDLLKPSIVWQATKSSEAECP